MLMYDRIWAYFYSLPQFYILLLANNKEVFI